MGYLQTGVCADAHIVGYRQSDEILPATATAGDACHLPPATHMTLVVSIACWHPTVCR
jgi:hypothetical protein